MHELAIARAVVETAARHAQDRRVTAVRLRLGRLRQVVPQSLIFSFGVVASETACSGARLELDLVQARLRCRACGAGWDPAPAPAPDRGSLIEVPRFRCPACGEGGEVVSGEEMEVESIEVEEPVASVRGAAAR